jgi:hypothetical protein
LYYRSSTSNIRTNKFGTFLSEPCDRTLLFKGDCLKIADLGLSRVLAQGETAVETGSSGGTQVS